MICPLIVHEFLKNHEKISFKPQKDYYAIFFSFDQNENLNDLKIFEREHLLSLKDNPYGEGLKTLILKDSINLYKLVESIGFKFKKVNGAFVHPSVFVFVSPNLKITRYIYGPSFLPLELELAIHETSEGKLGSIRVKATKFCLSYDPKGRKYVFNFIKVFMIFSIIFVISFAIFLAFWVKSDKRRNR
ncbi:MAG: hypothetical protein ABDH49_08340 [Candidatus Hydrothermales bacterium]